MIKQNHVAQSPPQIRQNIAGRIEVVNMHLIRTDFEYDTVIAYVRCVDIVSLPAICQHCNTLKLKLSFVHHNTIQAKHSLSNTRKYIIYF